MTLPLILPGFIVGIALVIRVGCFLVSGPISTPDSGMYLLIARNLARTGSFCWFDPAVGKFIPFAGRMPLFQAMIAALIVLLGPDVIHPIVYVNWALSAATVALTYWIGSRVAGVSAGCAAAMLMAISPASIVNSSAVMTDTLFCFWMTASIACGIRTLEQMTMSAATTWGLTLALGCLTRPVLKFYIFLPLVLLALAVKPRKRGIRLGIVVFLIPALALSAWCGRNIYVLSFCGLEWLSGVNSIWNTMDLVRPSTAEERARDPELSQLRDITTQATGPLDAVARVRERTHLSLIEIDRLFLKLGMEVVSKNPGEVFKRVWINAVNFLTGPASVQTIARSVFHAGPDVEARMRTLYKEQKWLYLVMNLLTRLFSLALVALALCGTLRTWRGLPGVTSLLALTFLYHLALASAVNGDDRYRLAVDPVLFTLAAARLFHRPDDHSARTA